MKLKRLRIVAGRVQNGSTSTILVDTVLNACGWKQLRDDHWRSNTKTVNTVQSTQAQPKIIVLVDLAKPLLQDIFLLVEKGWRSCTSQVPRYGIMEGEDGTVTVTATSTTKTNTTLLT